MQFYSFPSLLRPQNVVICHIKLSPTVRPNETKDAILSSIHCLTRKPIPMYNILNFTYGHQHKLTLYEAL